MSASPPPGIPYKPGDMIADKYRVERVLGVGGMGVVLAAINVQVGKRVALKMMLPEAVKAPKAIERFEREARAAGQLRSDHVAEVLDIGKLPDGSPFIVMELLEGVDFEGVLKRTPRMAVEDVVEYALQACQALGEAHAAGVVHRDLKPRNLFLSQRSDGSPLVKVLDFGISKWTLSDTGGADHSLTKTSDVMGSPNYMSPEQVRSAKDVDGRTDIWSMGVVLFELLTGHVPFVAESLPQLCAMILEKEPAAIGALRPDVPAGLVAVVNRCLEKKPENRFPTIADLARALEPFGLRRSFSASGNMSGAATVNALSPNASTLAMAAPIVMAPNTGPPYPGPIAPGSGSGAGSGAGFGGGLPAASSSGPVPGASSSSPAGNNVSHQASNGTGVSWGATRFEASRRSRTYAFVAGGVGVALLGTAAVIGGNAYLRSSTHPPAPVDAAPTAVTVITVDAGGTPVPTSQATASTVASAVASVPTASASALVTAPVSATGRPPVRPPPPVASSAPKPNPTTPTPTTPTAPPTIDPLTPPDRK